MICEVCKEKQAVFHVQQINGDNIYEMHLCRDCASRKGISRDGKSFDFSLSRIISGFLEDQVMSQENISGKLKCGTCGTPVDEIRSNNLVGCPDCYNTFRSAVRKQISVNGKGIHHTGKLPEKLKAYKTILIDKEKLKRQLEEAVDKEDYENAVILRDKLANLEAGFGVDED